MTASESLDDLIVRLKAVPTKAFLRLPTRQPFISAELPIGELCQEAATALDLMKEHHHQHHAERHQHEAERLRAQSVNISPERVQRIENFVPNEPMPELLAKVAKAIEDAMFWNGTVMCTSAEELAKAAIAAMHFSEAPVVDRLWECQKANGEIALLYANAIDEIEKLEQRLTEREFVEESRDEMRQRLGIKKRECNE